MNEHNQRGLPETTVEYRTVFDETRGPPPSIAVAMALADLEDAPACRTDFTLAATIDPDALDDLVTGTHDARVTFTIQNYLVVVQGDGRIRIRRAGK